MLASCWTSNGAGGAGAAVFDGARVGDCVGCAGGGVVGIGLAAEGRTVGVGGEVAMFWFAAFPLTGPAFDGPAAATGELAAPDVDDGGPLVAVGLLDAAGLAPVADGWPLVQAASIDASAIIEAAQPAGIVRSRLAIWPG